MHLVGALMPLIEAGRIKVYSCDNLAGRAFASRTGSVEYRCALLNRFQDCIAEEVVPAIRADCRDASAEVVAAGASLGAFMAVAVACRYPWAFRAAVGMSGTYDLERLFEFKGNEDYYFATPMSFLPNLGSGALLDVLRRRFVRPRLRRRAVGEPRRQLAAGRGPRSQAGPEPGRPLGAGVRPRLADLAADAAALPRRPGGVSRGTNGRDNACRSHSDSSPPGRTDASSAARPGRSSGCSPPSASRIRTAGSGRSPPAWRSMAPRSRAPSGPSSAARSRATT